MSDERFTGFVGGALAGQGVVWMAYAASGRSHVGMAFYAALLLVVGMFLTNRPKSKS